MKLTVEELLGLMRQCRNDDNERESIARWLIKWSAEVKGPTGDLLLNLAYGVRARHDRDAPQVNPLPQEDRP